MRFGALQVMPKIDPLTSRATMTLNFRSCRNRWSHGRRGFDEAADNSKRRPGFSVPVVEQADEQLTDNGV